jgi:Domain of unknown function (DUF4260)
MTSSPGGQGAVSPGVGVAVGAPRRRPGLEGLVLLAGALIACSTLGQPWWLMPAGILVPDIAISGYAAGTRLGAHLYNLAHATALPAVMPDQVQVRADGADADGQPGRDLVLVGDQSDQFPFPEAEPVQSWFGWRSSGPPGLVA